MWANTARGRDNLPGVDDDGNLIGCTGTSQDQLNWHDKVGREFCPDARYDTKRVECVRTLDRQPDFVLLIRVYYREDKVVETNKGEAYIRRGDSRYRLSDDEKRELAIDKGQVSFEQEPCGLTYPGDFDMEAIREFAASVKQMKGLRTEYSPEQVLTNRHLGRMHHKEFIPNIACISCLPTTLPRPFQDASFDFSGMKAMRS